jgi:hypothetical protein
VESFAALAESAAAVVLDELKDSPDFLHALSRVMYRLVAWRPRLSKSSAHALELLSGEAPEPMLY